MNTLEKIDRFLNELDSTLLGNKRNKKESITTVSAGVPGDGPIADVQNGLAITQKDKESIKKNKSLLKSVMFSRLRESKLTSNEILDMIDIKKIIFAAGRNFNAVWMEVEKKLILLKSQLNVSLQKSDIDQLKIAIKKVL